MTCIKCGYADIKEIKKFNKPLCQICATFAPNNEQDFLQYISEKIDWKTLETFRKYNSQPGIKKKQGMQKSFSNKNPVTRPPAGYKIKNNKLIPNQDAAKIHSLFTVFLNKNYSLNSLAKHYGFSVNGIKKILTNRVYLGELKFDNQIVKANHKPLISPEIFYAVQRKLKKLRKQP